MNNCVIIKRLKSYFQNYSIYFRMKGTFDDLTISHLNWNKQDVNIPKKFDNNTKYSVYNLTLYNISMEGHYDVRGNLGELFDVFGKGVFW